MSATPFIGIPKQDQQLSSWAQNFSDVINAGPSAYGLSLTDAANIKSANDNFQATYEQARSPAMRTQVSVQAKNSFRNAMLATFRAYYVIIQNNPGVTDDNKLAAGIIVRSRSRSPRRVAESQPILSVIAATPQQQTVRFADATTPDKRHKPAYAVALQLFVYLGANPPRDPTLARFVGSFTKQPVALNYRPADVGQQATIWGRWQGVRGDVGPWSLGVSMQVA